jgi:hypothetical protein
MRDGSTAKLIQDISALIASILPIAQLFFSKLPDAFTNIFIASGNFVGISILTLIFSYVLIVSYWIKPWFTWTLPFQKRTVKYQGYIDRINSINDLKKEIVAEAGQLTASAKINKLTKELNKPAVKPPIRITFDNLVPLLLVCIIVNVVCFIVLSGAGQKSLSATVQSINYVFIVSLSALILTVYKKVSDNEKNWAEIRNGRTQKAIQLATINNTFANIPQVKFISCFEDNGFPSNFHTWVEYNGQKYEIITDSRAESLVAVYPFQ